MRRLPHGDGTPALSRGKSSIVVGCSSSGMVCQGTLKLVSGKKVVGKVAYSVKGGASMSVKLEVTKAGMRLLQKAPRHRISTSATATVAGGLTAKRTIVLKLRRQRGPRAY
jgi:hypothetical protein